MHCHSGGFIRFCMRSDCCSCCQNNQDGGRRISSLRRKTGWVCANFLERWLHYKVNNHPITKHKPIYHARNIDRWKGSVESRPFIDLLILDVINRFIFGHGVVIYYVFYMYTCTWYETGNLMAWYTQTLKTHLLIQCQFLPEDRIFPIIDNKIL